MPAPTSAVFITVPKYVAITPGRPLPKIRPLLAAGACNRNTQGAAMSPASSSGYASSSGGTDDGNPTTPRGKKRRLDHLSWEEKIQRKKLKNRVAAQTSRDRKKARMEEMELELKDLTETTEILQNKCDSLQTINNSLLEKNQKLDSEVEMLRQQLSELQQSQQEHEHEQSKQASNTPAATCAGCESILNGSAVSNCTDPLQQGSPQMDSQSTREQRNATLASLWRIVALCLLYKTCSSSTTTKLSSPTLMPASWRSWPKVCSPISQQTWRQAIERAIKLLPKLQAEQSDCLDQWWGPQQSAWNPANIEVAA